MSSPDAAEQPTNPSVITTVTGEGPIEAPTVEDISAIAAIDDADQLAWARAALESKGWSQVPAARWALAAVALTLIGVIGAASFTPDVPWWAWAAATGVLVVVGAIVAGWATSAERTSHRALAWIHLLDRRIAQLDSGQVVNIVDSPGSNFHGTVNLSLWGKTVSTATVEG